MQPARTGVRRPITQPGRPATGAVPAQPVSEIEGLRSWVAQLDRKLGLRTYLTLAAALLALACSIVAVVLAIDARDNAASSDDIANLEQEIAALQGAAAAVPATAGADTTALQDQVDQLDGKVEDLTAAQDATDKRIGVIEDDIDDLRSQISDLNGGGGGN